MKSPRHILIAGLGLMGGSLAAACRKKFPRIRITAVSRNSVALKKACREGWIDRAFRAINKEALTGVDFAVLCTPVNTLPSFLTQIENYAASPLIVTDVGSVKGGVIRFYEGKRWRNVRFVGSHPMVGSHMRGMEAAHPLLYENGLGFICAPGKKNDPKAFSQVFCFWKTLMARVVKVSAVQHDELTAQISHLPHALAVCLMLSVDQKACRFAGAGFWDTTRIAAGHPSIWLPIFRENQKALKKAMTEFEKKWKLFKEAVQKSDPKALERILKEASHLRLEEPRDK